jgi:hypothetical protein
LTTTFPSNNVYTNHNIITQAIRNTSKKKKMFWPVVCDVDFNILERYGKIDFQTQKKPQQMFEIYYIIDKSSVDFSTRRS